MQLTVAEKMIEAQAPDAEAMPRPQIGRCGGGVGHRDATQPIRLMFKRVEHGGIVAAMRAALDQNAARKTDGVEHGQIFFERCVRRRIAAIPGIGKPRGRPKHMGMGIAGVRRRR